MGIVLIIIYFSFIALGMSDSLLGTAWPSMNAEYLVPLSYAGAASVIVSGGKVISCLTSDKLSRKFGEARVIGTSTLLIAIGLFGIGAVHTFPALLIFSVPFGIGTGFLDVTVNSYVAVHYESRFNSWLHCFWSLGTSVGPIIMGWCIAGKSGWGMGYFISGVIAAAAAGAILLSSPKWKRHVEVKVDGEVRQMKAEHLPFLKVITLPGVFSVMLFAFCYEGMQNTAMLWSGTFLTYKGLSAELSASLVSALFIGIMISRFINGFLTMKFSDRQLIRMGSLLIAVGILCMFFLPGISSVFGLICLGVGMAPIMPCLMHTTAQHSDPKYAPAIVSAQMAFLFFGSTLLPPIFGLIAEHISVALFAPYLFVVLVFMIILQEKAIKE